jgi:two-component system cell cycle response regulator
MTGRILLIESDVPSMEMMFHLLTNYGYFPLRARNGEEGVLLAAREHPDLIISNVEPAFVDGFDVARRIRADPASNDIPMLALTSGMPEERKQALDAGYDGYLFKPFSPEAFARHVQAFLRPEFRAGRRSAEPPAAPPSAPRPGRKVLVVDDTPENLTLASRVLESAGFQVATAKGMSEAMRLARSDPPDLIVSDVVMADGSGYEFIRAVKAETRLRSIPFIFNTSTMATESARERGIALGAAGFLFRPLAAQDMLRLIEACLARAP